MIDLSKFKLDAFRRKLFRDLDGVEDQERIKRIVQNARAHYNVTPGQVLEALRQFASIVRLHDCDTADSR